MSVNLHRDATPLSIRTLNIAAKEDSLEHGDAPEHLGRVLECVLEVLEDGLLLDRLLYPPLCLDAVRVRLEHSAIPFRFLLHLVCLPQQLGEPCRIILGCLDELGIRL